MGLSLYIHWPFCVSKCPYCDFNSHVQDTIDIDSFKAAYLKDITEHRKIVGHREVQSLFFGGGTPSLMPPSLVGYIIEEISRAFHVSSECEISLEANPNSSESAKFLEFKQVGINRLSLGVQSLRDDDLKFLGRPHSAQEALEALKIAKKVFNNYSFDLIYARPHQTLALWKSELEEVLDFVGNHLSLYQLTIEEGTPFFTRFHRGEFSLPDESTSVEMYEETRHILSRKGLKLYEVSNFAQPGKECKHNMTYWTYGDFIGIGPGAHGRLEIKGQGKIKTRHHRAPKKWLEQMASPKFGFKEKSTVSQKEQFHEMIMMGLRLTQGIPHEKIQSLLSPMEEKVFAEKINPLIREGYIEKDTKTLRTTPNGRLRLDGILRFLFC